MRPIQPTAPAASAASPRCEGNKPGEISTLLSAGAKFAQRATLSYAKTLQLISTRQLQLAATDCRQSAFRHLQRHGILRKIRKKSAVELTE